MKRFLLIAPLLLGACAVPVAQPVTSADTVRVPPAATSQTAPPPAVNCCSSPTTWPSQPPPAQPERAAETAPLPPTPADEVAIAKDNRAFALSLYRELAAKPGNVFISPISIAGAFGPVAAGARGQTRAEIGKVLHFPAGDDALNGSLGSILHTLESGGGGSQVSIANALWVSKHASIEPDFIDMAKRSYDAEVETLDFHNSPAAAARINAWVDRETNGRIPQLFEPKAFDAATALVVTDAVYFLSDWKVPFDARRTNPQPFHLTDGTTREVPMMVAEHMTARLVGPEPGAASSGVKDGLQLLELPYKGDRLSMVIILPNEMKGLPVIEAQLSAAKLDEWLGQLDSAALSEEVDVALPKVQIESSYDLVKPLKALGMKLAFRANVANFTGISTDRGNPLFINDVVHKSFLKIDEKGTEAAAATGIELRGERGGAGFRADHPFLLLIRDKPTGAILFMGRVAEP
jgi:serpin B